jgi:hypothetical protein
MTNSGSNFTDSSSCSFSYNIGTGNQFGTYFNNKSNVPMDSVFVCWSDCSASSSDGRYALKANSPAKGAGMGGADMGAFGGTHPYVLSGLPNIPAIYKYDVWNSPNHININLKAKSHN